MNGATTTAGFPFDRWSLYLFVTGLLGPFVVLLTGRWTAPLIASMNNQPLSGFEPFGLALWVMVISLILACICGALGLSSPLGKVALALSSISLVLIGAYFFVPIPAADYAPAHHVAP